MFDITSHFRSISVLDHGHLELIDGMVSDPLIKIVNSARVSFRKQVTEITESDVKLIRFLYKHAHFSTFRHSYYSFRWKAPLFVFRQAWKYQIASNWVENENVGTIEIPETNWNEMSGRYVEFVPEFYIPETIRIQSKNNKQGSEGKLEALANGQDPVEFYRASCMRQYQDYSYLVSQGAAKEQVRALLPQNIYSECIWTASLQTILYFLQGRLKSDAQYEIRQYALALYELMKPMLEQIAELIPAHEEP